MHRLTRLLSFLSLFHAFTALAQGNVADAIRAADAAHDAISFLAEDARFLADSAIAVGDSQGWQRYQAFASAANNVAFDYDGYGNDLGNGLPLRMVEQNYAFKRNDLRQLDLAYVRLRDAPGYFSERYVEFQAADAAFLAAVQTPPPDPNGEPDVPGHWQCTAQWSMNGTWMRFSGEGNSRNAAKAAALAQCQQRVGRFCELGACQQLGSRLRVSR